MSMSSLKLLQRGLLLALVIVAAMFGVWATLGPVESRFLTLVSLVLATLISGACVVDSKILRRPMVFIAQAALFFLWPFAAPVYLIWARGWRGLLILIVCCTILLGAMVTAVVITAFATTALQFVNS